MPHVLDRAIQVSNEIKMTKKFGAEIEAAGLGKEATADLLPELEKIVPLGDLQAFNEKMRQWIDAHS